MQKEEKRPSPENLLKQIEEEDISPPVNAHNGRKKGRLKLFLGYCAGVGKTYRMLEEAGSAKKHGIDVVVVVAETHGRKETQALLNGLEIIPKKKIQYKELRLEEMDLDALLKRRPQLAIVDELAHTNAPGSKHPKRYQDVEELLNAGIDVFTTLNIQHLESIIDVVYQITQIKVHETVPDRIVELADEIELVDLPPEKLLERLREGKIYIPQKAETAMRKFFTRGNLLTLRELSLRYTAKRVDQDILSYKESHSILTSWPIGSRLLVAISPSPSSENLLRVACRMAMSLDAEWYAVYVESPQAVLSDENAQHQLNSNIRLAEELGAKVFPLSGNSIADEILNFANQKNIMLIIAGVSHRSKLDQIIKGNVLNELIKKSGPPNILIIGDEEPERVQHRRAPLAYKKNYLPYLLSFISIFATVGVISLLNFWVKSPVIGGMLLLIPAIASSLVWGTRVSIFASVLAAAAFYFFFLSPQFTFKIIEIQYLPIFLVFIIVSLIVGSLAKIIRWQAESAKLRERFLSSLYSFNREIMLCEALDDILDRAVKRITEAFQGHVIILLPDKDSNLELRTELHISLTLNENERAAATWVYKNALAAGKNTATLSALKWHYLPLNIKNKTIGVIALTPIIQKHDFSPEQYRLFQSFANVVALALYKIT